jgi:hypothetical protein
MSSKKVPVIYIAFNRPCKTKITFEAVREYQPEYLFIICDGPRHGNSEDDLLVSNVKKVFDVIDWECNVQLNYSLENMGCKKRVASGISWAFEFVDRAIIIEDDCLVSGEFFNFCELALNYYQNRKDVMTVSGSNFIEDLTNGKPYLTKFNHIWGWATWKRAWDLYEMNMNSWPNWKRSSKWRDLWQSYGMRKYWQKVFDSCYENKIDTWDLQLTAAIWKNCGYSINSGSNLVSNIGFDMEATHTKEINYLYSNKKINLYNIKNDFINTKINDNKIEELIFQRCYLEGRQIGNNFFTYYIYKILNKLC